MNHLPALVQDLALILMVAGFVTILFKKLRQPVVLGYIVAGFLVGPHMDLVPTITDGESIKVWAEIGIIFLLFALGLEFSFTKLAHIGGAASITAFIEVVTMVGIGFLTGRAFGWSNMDSIFLGGILAISSTTIIIRAFEELGMKTRGFAKLVFGVLIVEDLFAVLLLVILSTVAVGSKAAGAELLTAMLKLGFFLVGWFTVGIFVLPTLLRRSKPFLDSETLSVVSLGFCFAMVVAATKAGFSPALGAFVMGSILAETQERERIEHIIKPIKDLFAAIFFVSVGMLIDPKLLAQYAGPVLIITAVTVVGKLGSTVAGALISGRSLRHSIQSGFSLAQIGEFSFIIASLGVTLQVTSDFLYPIAVGVSALTTFFTPYLIRSADSAHLFISKRLPANWQRGLTGYQSSSQRITSTNEWRDFVRSYAMRLVLNGVIIATIFFVGAKLSGEVSRPLGLFVVLLLCAPFLWAMTLSPLGGKAGVQLWQDKRQRASLVVLEASRVALAIALLGFLASQFVTWRSAFAVTIALIFAFLLLFSRYLKRVYQWFEKQFIGNLNEGQQSSLAPWDAHIVRVDVPPESEFVGKTLEELKIRERYGVTIAMIERGRIHIAAPTRDERVYPGDRISVIGVDEQIAGFREGLAPNISDAQATEIAQDYSLKQFRVGPDSQLKGKTIRDCGIREKSHGLVVGLERGEKRTLNPDSTMTIDAGDILWIVGETALLKRL